MVAADVTLVKLRKPGESGYKIPRGGLFEYVSAANYFSEIVEWVGYAIASGGSLPAIAFAFYTFCNVAPRGHSHHRYKGTMTGCTSYLACASVEAEITRSHLVMLCIFAGGTWKSSGGIILDQGELSSLLYGS